MGKIRTIFSADAFRVLDERNFRMFLFYRFFLTVATLMQSVIVGWQIYDLTKNVFLLGIIGLTEALPQICISLFAGHFIDIYDRRKIIIYTSVLLLIGSGVLVVYSIPVFNMYALYGTFPIFFTIFLTGFVRGILMPAHTALIGQIVKRERLASAATWSSTVWHIAAVVGPAIGGLIYGFFGVVAAYSFVFLFFLTGTVLMTFTQIEKIIYERGKQASMFTSIKEGIDFVFKNQVLLGALSLDMFAVLFGGAVAMLPVFASDILKTGPQGLGLLRACPAIGAIIMSVILTVNPPVNKSGRYLFISVTGFGLCMIGFALSENFYLSAAILLFSGLFDNISVVIRGTIVQLFTPNEMRGRVAAVNSIFIGSSNEIGAFESGAAAKLLGLVPSVIFGGVMTLLVSGTTAAIAPKLRKLSLKENV